jgi:hypothetical protein
MSSQTGHTAPAHEASTSQAPTRVADASQFAHRNVTAPMQRLQQSLGNQAIAQMLLRSHPIAAVDSPAERQAAAFAGGAGRPTGIARATSGTDRTAVPGSHGRPLEPQVRRPFEQALGADLSSVRIHDDAAAHAFARDVGARAATLGSHIYFSKDRYAPHAHAGRALLSHELVHTLQPEARSMLHRTPESEARLAEIERLLDTTVITEDYRRDLETERATLLAEGNRQPAAPGGTFTAQNPTPGTFTPPNPAPSPAPVGQPVNVITMSVAEFEAQTGMSAALLPDAPAEMTSEEEPPRWPSAVPGAVGSASLFTPKINWYYRGLTPHDPTLSQLLGGADLLPRPLAPGLTFKLAASEAEMTFRHLRGVNKGDLLKVSTDRISTAADLEAFRTTLAQRGTGELARVDVEAARRLGAQFFEQGDVMGHLERIGVQITEELAKARATGRGGTYIKGLQGRLRALEAAKAYARTFAEGQGVGRIPGGAITKVRGSNLASAVAGEQALRFGIKAFRYGGRVMIVVGAVMSVERVVNAPEGQHARVATQEVGGWAFSLAGAEAGAGGGAALGAALGIETGPGAVAFAVLGALVGGAIGFFGGEEAADKMYDLAEGAAKGLDLLSQPAKLIETSEWMFGTPESRRAYYEMRELETGEPSPFSGF